jgi:hypothetical protein
MLTGREPFFPLYLLMCPATFAIDTIERAIFGFDGEKVYAQGYSQPPAINRPKHDVMEQY